MAAYSRRYITPTSRLPLQQADLKVSTTTRNAYECFPPLRNTTDRKFEIQDLGRARSSDAWVFGLAARLSRFQVSSV
jgi:hypothetical protein